MIRFNELQVNPIVAVDQLGQASVVHLLASQWIQTT